MQRFEKLDEMLKNTLGGPHRHSPNTKGKYTPRKMDTQSSVTFLLPNLVSTGRLVRRRYYFMVLQQF